MKIFINICAFSALLMANKYWRLYVCPEAKIPTTKYHQTRVIYTTNIQLMANAMLKFNCTAGRMSDISTQTFAHTNLLAYIVCRYANKCIYAYINNYVTVCAVSTLVIHEI